MKIPVTLLSTYMYCPRKVFLQRVLRLKEPPRQPLLLGTIRHEALEAATNAEEGMVAAITGAMEPGEIFSLYESGYSTLLRSVVLKHSTSLGALGIDPLDAYLGALPTLVRESRVRAANLERFMKETRLFGPELWEALVPKILSEIPIESDALRLTGIIDRVQEFPDRLIPVELKSGKMPREGVWPGHRVQAAAYALLLEERYRKKVPEAIVHYLDAKEQRMIAINAFMKGEIVKLVDEVLEILSSLSLPGFCPPNKCVPCGLRKKCHDREMMENAMASLQLRK